MPVDAVDDVLVVMRLVESGNLSAQDAEQLLEALSASPHAAEPSGETRRELVVRGDIEGKDEPARLDIETPACDMTLGSTDGSEARVVLSTSLGAARRPSGEDLATALRAAISERIITVRPITENLGHLRHLTLAAFLPRQAIWHGTVRADNGPIKLLDLRCGDLDVETTNGRVGATRITGNHLTVTTTNGGIELNRFKGRATLRTANGAVALRLLPETLDGEDRWRLSDGVEADVNAVIASGSFHAHLPEGVAADVTATTSGGRIDANGPVQQQVSLRGTIHWRTPDWDEADRKVRLVVRTSNGSIRIAYADSRSAKA